MTSSYAMTEKEKEVQETEERTPQTKLPSCIAESQGPLHTLMSRLGILKLISEGYVVNKPNILGETPLHAQVMRNNFEGVVTLLSRGAELDGRDYKGNTPLHGAILYNSKLSVVKCLVVFGACTTVANKSGESPLSIVQNSMPCKKRDDLLAVLSIGYTGISGSTVGSLSSEERQQLREQMKSQGNVDADEFSSVQDLPAPPPPPPRKRKKKDNVLCLDGGGIRGMILTQLMMAVQDHLEKPLVEYFDWISGTSIGGILALALAKRYSVRECLAMLFRMKDNAFNGRRPYKPEPLEEMLRDVFGADTPMSSIEKPKLLIPACMADRLPLNLHFFRNYQHPPSQRISYSVDPMDSLRITRKLETDYHTQLMWKAGRATGAAPTYYRSFEGYLDGGLIANNPTLDALTEIFEYFNQLKIDGTDPPELGLVLSLGAGMFAPESIAHFDIYRPETFQELKTTPKILMGFSTLGRMIVAQATDTDGRVVDRCRIWCQSLGVPFYRFSPHLSRYLPLDCKDDEQLIEALWETRLYAATQVAKLKRISDLLRR